MALKFKSIFSTLLSAILSLLGFDSCKTLLGEDPDIGSQVCMYGCPYAEYTVKGTVTDSKRNPLEGISVAVLCPRDTETDTLFKAATDSTGQISATFEDYCFSDSKNLTVELKDVDGPENGGQFATKNFSASATLKKKGSGWKAGEYEIKFSKTLEKE